MSRSLITGLRLLLLVVSVTACFGVLFSRLIWLHVLEQPRLAAEVNSNRERVDILTAPRGNIVDARGKLLAATRSVITVGVDPMSFDEADRSNLPELALLLDISLDELTTAIDKKYRTIKTETGHEKVREVRWVKLAEGIDEYRYKKILQLGVKGVYGNRKYERIYPSGQLASHILGFLNKENTPVMGVERYLDFYLDGQDGWRESEADARRREMAQFRSREVEPTPGLHVELTLDLYVQHVVEVELQRIAKDYDPKSATIIVSDPATGIIYGLSNYPTFDPNNVSQSTQEQRRNRALTDTYEPGSTFKVVPVAAVLNEGIHDRQDQIDCKATFANYEGRRVPLPSDHHEMGLLSVEEVLVQSSNRGAGQMGIALGEERLYEYASRFGYGEQTGLGEKLGLGKNTETAGILHPVNKWDGYMVGRIPMGHAISATPMQVHYAMASLANGGILMEPQVLRRVFNDEGESVVSFWPNPRRRVISSDVASEMADILSGVTQAGGTARRAGIDGFQVAGKTGTTQKIIDGKYSSNHHVGSFSGFFPANAPRLVITVVVDDPQLDGIGYGGVVAAPAFRNVATKLIQYFGIQPVPTVDNDFLALGAPNE